MAQVMVNFRIDEDVKKSMEQACREMGLSMSTAFTVFAKKVGKEKRIPFEITAESQRPEPRQRARREPEQGHEEEPLLFARKQERLETLCTAIRRSLTSIHTAIPSSITGLSMERIRMLCGDELKDKAAGITNSVRTLFSGRNAEMLPKKDLSILDEYVEGLSYVAHELQETEYTLIPAMRAWHGDGSSGFEAYEQRLAAISQKMDALSPVMQRFLSSTAVNGGANAAMARLRQYARGLETAYVMTALDGLESLIIQHYDALDEKTRARLDSDYFQTLELTLQELGRAERSGGDVVRKASLCLRVINVVTHVITVNSQLRQEQRAWDLEAEVAAMESMAAIRGDVPGGIKPE